VKSTQSFQARAECGSVAHHKEVDVSSTNAKSVVAWLHVVVVVVVVAVLVVTVKVVLVV
jgi:hypothetical protein